MLCAIITGGAGGIGFHTAKELAKRGVKLALVDVSSKALEDAKATAAPLP